MEGSKGGTRAAVGNCTAEGGTAGSEAGITDRTGSGTASEGQY